MFDSDADSETPLKNPLIRKPPSKTPLTVKGGVCHGGSFRILVRVSQGFSDTGVCITGVFRIQVCVSQGFSESSRQCKPRFTSFFLSPEAVGARLRNQGLPRPMTPTHFKE